MFRQVLYFHENYRFISLPISSLILKTHTYTSHYLNTIILVFRIETLYEFTVNKDDNIHKSEQ